MLALLLLVAAGSFDRNPTDVTGCCSGNVPLRWTDYNRAVVWTEDLGQAAARAQAEGKFLLVFRLVGDLRSGGT